MVNEAGAVESPEVVRSPDDRLTQAALEAVRQVRFRPGRVDGEPVKVRFAIPVVFRIPADEAP